MKRKKELHQAEVERLKEEASRCATLFDVLKKDFEHTTQEKAKAEKQRDDAVAALTVHAQNDQKLKQICEDNEARSKKAEAKLAAYKTESANWLSELNLLNRDMDRKLSKSSSLLPCSNAWIHILIEWMLTLTSSECRGVHSVSLDGLQSREGHPSREREGVRVTIAAGV